MPLIFAWISGWMRVIKRNNRIILFCIRRWGEGVVWEEQLVRGAGYIGWRALIVFGGGPKAYIDAA